MEDTLALFGMAILGVVVIMITYRIFWKTPPHLLEESSSPFFNSLLLVADEIESGERPTLYVETKTHPRHSFSPKRITLYDSQIVKITSHNPTAKRLEIEYIKLSDIIRLTVVYPS